MEVKRARLCMSMNACPNLASERDTLSNSVVSALWEPHAMHGGNVDLGPLAMQVGHNSMQFSGPHVIHGGSSVGTDGSMETVGIGTVRVGESQSAGGWSGKDVDLAALTLAAQASSAAKQRMKALRERVRAKSAVTSEGGRS